MYFKWAQQHYYSYTDLKSRNSDKKKRLRNISELYKVGLSIFQVGVQQNMTIKAVNFH